MKPRLYGTSWLNLQEPTGGTTTKTSNIFQEKICTYPLHSDHVVTDEHAGHELGLDTGPDHHRLEIRQFRLVDEDGRVSGSLQLPKETAT